MKLAQIETAPEGPETKPPLLVAHGLFGSARNWNGVAKMLNAGRRVVAVDMRNHGESPHDPSHSYADMAGDLLEMLEGLGGEADLLGHSMGGKAAMVLALGDPGPLRRLIVADIAPVAYAHSHLPYIRAMQAIDLSQITRRSEAEKQLAEAVDERSLRAFLLHSLANGPDGLFWRLNLDALAEAMETMIGWDGPDGEWTGPTLFLRGGKSDYASSDKEAAMLALFPNAEIETLPSAGHWLHAEQPKEFADAAARFLDA